MDKKKRAKILAKRLTFCDTIIVSAGDDYYQKIFVAEGKWYPIKLSQSRIPQIKYVAIYRTTPISEISDLCKVSKIIPFRNSEQKYYKYSEQGFGKTKYVLEIDKTIHHRLSIPLGDDKKMAPQGPVFGISKDILIATSIKEVFSLDKFL